VFFEVGVDVMFVDVDVRLNVLFVWVLNCGLLAKTIVSSQNQQFSLGF